MAAPSPPLAKAPPRWLAFLGNVRELAVKELISLWRDRSLLVLVAYAFTLAIVLQANGMKHDLNRAAVAVVAST